MRNFQLIGRGLDMVPLLHAVQTRPYLWNAHTLRTTYPNSPRAAVDDIWLWFNEVGDPAAVIDDRETRPYPAWAELPQARRLVFDLMHRIEASRLGRVLITRLPPGRRIAPHADQGAPAEYYARYQLAMQSLPGCTFRIGDETVTFQGGDVWWIDNTKEYEVVNGSADDRVVLIVDARLG